MHQLLCCRFGEVQHRAPVRHHMHHISCQDCANVAHPAVAAWLHEPGMPMPGMTRRGMENQLHKR